MPSPSISITSPWSFASVSWTPQVERCFYFSETSFRPQKTEFHSCGTRHRTRMAEKTVKTYAISNNIPADPKHEQSQRTTFSELPQSVVVLDIEGTTTPISFVTDSLFPYARDNVRNHLLSTFETEETQADIDLLRKQAEEDVKVGIIGAKLIPSHESPKEEITEAAAANVYAMIEADRKITALKELQGHIWRCGFAKGELQGDVFEDVPKALLQWYNAGTKVYIYSSGSREAQRLIFGNTQYGDLRPFLSGYFDTVTAGNKRESRSYKEIYLSVGVDEPSQIVFATDVLQEAIAAREAGLRTVILVRPGNAHLPPEHGFKAVTTLLEI